MLLGCSTRLATLSSRSSRVDELLVSFERLTHNFCASQGMSISVGDLVVSCGTLLSKGVVLQYRTVNSVVARPMANEFMQRHFASFEVVEPSSHISSSTSPDAALAAQYIALLRTVGLMR